MTNFELSGLFMQMHARRRHYISSLLKDEDLHMGQLPILVYVIEHSGGTQQDIAETLNITAASVATSCKRMEQAGLLERRVDEQNRRCNRLYATAHGEEVALRTKRMFDEVDCRMYDALDQNEREVLIGMLQKIIAAFDGYETGLREEK